CSKLLSRIVEFSFAVLADTECINYSFWGAQHPCPNRFVGVFGVAESKGRPAAFGSEGNGISLRQTRGGRECFPQGSGRGVGVGIGTDMAQYQLPSMISRCKLLCLSKLHGALRQCAGFVYTHRIDAGEDFYGGLFLDEDLFAAEADGGDSKRNSCHQR